MTSSQLRQQLDDLKKKEALAQTREQLLLEDMSKLLEEVATLFKSIKKLEIIPEEELTTENLQGVISKLQNHIDSEIKKSTIPPELL